MPYILYILLTILYGNILISKNFNNGRYYYDYNQNTIINQKQQQKHNQHTQTALKIIVLNLYINTYSSTHIILWLNE